MPWSKRGAHPLLQTRVKTLNHEVRPVFKRWYPDMEVEERPEATSSPASPCSPRSAGGQRRGLSRCPTHCLHHHQPRQNLLAVIPLSRVMGAKTRVVCRGFRGGAHVTGTRANIARHVLELTFRTPLEAIDVFSQEHF